VLLASFLLTVFIDLTTAIQVGVLLAAFLFLQRMSMQTQLNQITQNLRENDDGETRDMSGVDIPKGVEVFEIYGSLFFGAVEHFKDAIRRVSDRPRVMIIRMRDVPSLDASGLHTLVDLLRETRGKESLLILSAVADQPLKVMRQSGFAVELGEENIAPDIFAALEIARRHLENSRTGDGPGGIVREGQINA
jgi:SulP family sulfate permease